MKYFLSITLLLISLTGFSQSSDHWTTVETTNEPLARHENSFVECDGKFYLLGGRGVKPIEEYNPKTNTWKTLAMAPMESRKIEEEVPLEYSHVETKSTLFVGLSMDIMRTSSLGLMNMTRKLANGQFSQMRQDLEITSVRY